MHRLFILSASLSSLLCAQPQFLDPTFDGDGMVTTSMGGTLELIFSMALQGDGKIVVGGDTRTGGVAKFALARYHANGGLDSGFGAGGKVMTPIGGFASAAAVAVQGDGKIVAGGVSLGTTLDLTLARYKADGTLDSGFSGDGIASTHAGTGNNVARSMVLQADGKIVLAGHDASGFLLARFDSSGSLDSAFGTGGVVATVFSGGVADAFSALLQTDGKIVAAGVVSGQVAMARYKPNGSLDSAFGTAGKVVFNPGFSGAAAALQADGKILVGGEAFPNPYDFGVVRFDTLGAVDSSFGTAGMVKTDILGASRDHVSSLLVQPDGRIVVAGYAGQVTAMPLLGFALVRYLSNGTLDAGFGIGGKISTDFGGGNNTTGAIALQADGKIVAGGGFSSGTAGFTLARYSNTPTAIASLTLAVKPGSMRLHRRDGKDVLQYVLGKGEVISIDLYHANGKNIRSLLGKSPMAKGSHEQPIDLPGGLAHGRYYVVLSSGLVKSGLALVK